MKFLTEQILQFAENPKNFPEMDFSEIIPQNSYGSIRRFIYSNQSIEINISKAIVNSRPDIITVIPEMDSDIIENQKYYADGVAFCEFDCYKKKMFITQDLYEQLNDNTNTLIKCMVYAIELANETCKQLLKQLTTTQINYNPIIPEFKIDLDNTTRISKFKSPKFYSNLKFEHHDDIINQPDTVKTMRHTSVLYINIPYEIYSECMNNMHHLNYNLNYNQFMCLRKSPMNFKAVCRDIQKNGINIPLTFELIDGNIAPIENSSRILMAILLKLPVIPSCIYLSEVKFEYNNIYMNSKNTIDKLNALFYPYFIISH